jgi:hypothetical protein
MKRLVAVCVAVVVLFVLVPGTSAAPASRPSACARHQRPVGHGFCTHDTNDRPTEQANELCLNALAKLIRICYTPPRPGPVTPPPPPPGCIGDGVTGNRIQAFYAYTQTNDLESHRTEILGALGQADRYLAAGSGKHYRWVCSGGEPTIIAIKVADNSLNSFINAAINAGYTSDNRIYTALIDGGGGGTATIESDDSPGQTNFNNSGPAYSITRGTGAWPTVVHELGHNLGAVQLSAPHSSGAWHCFDGYDVMCYNDNGPYFQNGGQMTTSCPDTENQWDCHDDDYSNPAPPAGNYLFGHWNLVNSSFLG